MESKHTKLPWFVSHSKAAVSPISKRIFKSIKTTQGIGGNIVCNVFAGSGFDIDKGKLIEEVEATAAYIVKACNAHEELKNCLQAFVYQIETYNLKHEFPGAYMDAKNALQKVK